MKRATTSYAEIPADEVVAWCDLTIVHIKSERVRRNQMSVAHHLEHLRKWWRRGKRFLPRWLYNKPEPQEQNALDSLDADDEGLVGWKSEYGWGSLEVAKRVRSLACAAKNLDNPVYVTAEDYRHINPQGP